MKRTIVATKPFTVKDIQFIPSDEFDYIALEPLGMNVITFRNLVKVRHIAYGVPGRSIQKVAEASGYDFDEKSWKVGSKKLIVEEDNESSQESDEKEANQQEEVASTKENKTEFVENRRRRR